ncbi:MAG: PKD domain-containing protein [Flavobacteriales bacterium]
MAFCIAHSADATHIVGGDIHYTCNGGNSYTITMKIYRDCYNGVSPYDDPAGVGAFDQFGNLVYDIDMDLAGSQIDTLSTDTGDPCLNPPTNVCVTECAYVKTVDIDVPVGGLTLAYQRCCRNTSIVNCASNDDIGMTITAFIPDPSLAVCNSNPAFINFPPVFICMNEPFTMDHSAVDADGDSLVYLFCNPLLENMPSNYINPPGAPPYPLLQFYPEFSATYPIASNPAFTIDPITGWLEGTPTELGQYVVGICVEEYRNGVLLSNTNRDFQFNITQCSVNTAAEIDTPDPCQGQTIIYGNNSNGTYFYWDFGDETTDADTSHVFEPQYFYPAEGLFDVMLVVNAGFACADTQVVQMAVYNPIIADWTFSEECINGIYYFDFEGGTLNGGDLNWTWTFAQGNPTTGNGQQVYDIAFGTNNPSITMEVSNGVCETSVTATVEIPELPYLVIEEQAEFCEGLTVYFNITDTNVPNDILWNFGDDVGGDTSTELNTEYTYGDYGTYTATVTAAPGSECPATYTTQIIVLPPDPIEGEPTLSEPNICDTLPRIVVNFNGSGYDDLNWSFGDGENSDLTSTQHIYEIPGNYTVLLTVNQELCDYTETFELPAMVGFGPILEEVIVPNVFTPNNDGKNEFYRMYYLNESVVIPDHRTFIDYLDYYHLRIYDRWGVMMYNSDTDNKQGWNGQLTQDSSDGVYYYILDYQRKCIDDKIISKEGHLELLRE